LVVPTVISGEERRKEKARKDDKRVPKIKAEQVLNRKRRGEFDRSLTHKILKVSEGKRTKWNEEEGGRKRVYEKKRRKNKKPFKRTMSDGENLINTQGASSYEYRKGDGAKK